MHGHLLTFASALALASGAAFAQTPYQPAPSAEQLEVQPPVVAPDVELEDVTGVVEGLEGERQAEDEAMDMTPAVGDLAQMSPDQLIGKQVIGSDGQEIGAVEDVIMGDEEGQMIALIVSVEGMDRRIAVPIDAAGLAEGEDVLQLATIASDDIVGMEEFQYGEATETYMQGMEGAGEDGAPPME